METTATPVAGTNDNKSDQALVELACVECGYPLTSKASSGHPGTWTHHGVTVRRDGTIAAGEYDGRGNYLDQDGRARASDVGDGTVRYQACWTKASCPGLTFGKSRA